MSHPKSASSEPPDTATCFAAVAELLERLEAHWALAGAFAAVADVIVHKLIAWRDRDGDDIRSILATGAALTEQYSRHLIRMARSPG